jgi:hypothetical protein
VYRDLQFGRSLLSGFFSSIRFFERTVTLKFVRRQDFWNH